MNKRAIALIFVIFVVMLVALAIIYAPNITEAILRMHTIPQH